MSSMEGERVLVNHFLDHASNLPNSGQNALITSLRFLAQMLVSDHYLKYLCMDLDVFCIKQASRVKEDTYRFWARNVK